MTIGIVRCRDCEEFVHPIFDWCDNPGAYLCDSCAAPYADADDGPQDHPRTAPHNPTRSITTANAATD